MATDFTGYLVWYDEATKLGSELFLPEMTPEQEMAQAAEDTPQPEAPNTADELQKIIPGITTIIDQLKCPAQKKCEANDYPVFQIIFNMVTHLNDSHEWSREKIADWIEVNL